MDLKKKKVSEVFVGSVLSCTHSFVGKIMKEI